MAGCIFMKRKSGSPHVTYIPIDFIEKKLDEKLAENGYDSALKTLFIWEGVTQYIPEKEVDDTLAFIANHSGAGSVVVFDYFPSSVLDETCELTEAVNLKKFVEGAFTVRDPGWE